MAAARCMGPLSLAMTRRDRAMREIMSSMEVLPVVLMKLGLWMREGGEGVWMWLSQTMG